MMGMVTVAAEMTWRTLNILNSDATTADFCQRATVPSIRFLTCKAKQSKV